MSEAYPEQPPLSVELASPEQLIVIRTHAIGLFDHVRDGASFQGYETKFDKKSQTASLITWGKDGLGDGSAMRISQQNGNFSIFQAEERRTSDGFEFSESMFTFSNAVPMAHQVRKVWNETEKSRFLRTPDWRPELKQSGPDGPVRSVEAIVLQERIQSAWDSYRFDRSPRRGWFRIFKV